MNRFSFATRVAVVPAALVGASAPAQYRTPPRNSRAMEAAFPILSKTLHEQFLARLAKDLTPEQIEMVKDTMTYNKVRVTYDAYCVIVPDLDDEKEARILEVLKEAREEAMDGGSAPEKHAIFQKHKDQLNAWLAARGHDVPKATNEWEARQEAARKAQEEADAKESLPQS